MKKLIRKQKFEYFWVVEKGELILSENTHIHAIFNHNFTYTYITKVWNEILKVVENTPSTQCEPVKDIIKVINYIFKEEVKLYSMSENIQLYIKNKGRALTNHQIENIITHDTWVEEKEEYITANNQDQYILEQSMFEKYENAHPQLHSWVDKLILNMREVKEEFFHSLNKIKKNNVVMNYLNSINKHASGYHLLFKALIFFHTLMAIHGGKQSHHNYVEKLWNVLVNLLNNNDPYLIANGRHVNDNVINWKTALHFEVWITAAFSSYFSVDKQFDIVMGGEYIRVKFVQEYKDIPFRDNMVKGFAPMLVAPKPWVLHINQDKTISWPIEEKKYGGYLNNGISFHIPICKPYLGSNNNFTYLKQEGIDAINYLQQTPVCVNRNLLRFIEDNKQIIYTNLLKGMPDDKEYITKIKNELKECKDDLTATLRNRDKLGPKGENTEQKTLINAKITALFNKKDKLTAQFQQLSNFASLIKTAQLYSKYEQFYFTYQVDFRGRIYVVSDILNYQGDKLARSLIYFKQQSKMDIYWFKLYCMRKYGGTLQIKSAAEMISYFNKQLVPLMIDFRRNNCWLTAADPWCFLNCCLEYERYLALGEGLYYSGMCIYFDATCSGSQLISLLFNIDDHAQELNLIPSDENKNMGDFYMKIIYEFRQYLVDNHLNISEIDKNLYKPELWRKMFKHIIMTLSYGLTKQGVLQKLKEVNKELAEGQQFTFEHLCLLQNAFWKFIDEQKLFKCLDLIQKLTTQLAKAGKDITLYSNKQGFTTKTSDAIWLFKQGYRVCATKVLTCDKKRTQKWMKNNPHKLRRVQTRLAVKHRDMGKIDEKQQKIAILPNLVHHLDAIWMHGVIHKLTPFHVELFVIHDCFGVSMGNPGILNKFVRESLYEFFQNRDNIYQLLLQLHEQKTEIPLEVKQELDNLIGKLEINLKDAFYLIFPG